MSELCVCLHGEIDMSNADELRQQLTEARRESDGGLVVDCSDVTFIDSSGMTVLIVAQRRFAEEGRSFRLTNASRAVRLVCDVMGVTRALGLRESKTDSASNVLSSVRRRPVDGSLQGNQQRDFAAQARQRAGREHGRAEQHDRNEAFYRRAADLHEVAAGIHDRVAAIADANERAIRGHDLGLS